jgi:hypothetical protein
MELLLGLSPMSQYDHFANPIMGGWDTAPNNSAAYTAILPPSNIIGEVNMKVASYDSKDPRRRLAMLSSKMNWNLADAAPYQVLNEILWKDAKGPSSRVPELRVSKLAVLDNNEAGIVRLSTRDIKVFVLQDCPRQSSPFEPARPH